MAGPGVVRRGSCWSSWSRQSAERTSPFSTTRRGDASATARSAWYPRIAWRGATTARLGCACAVPSGGSRAAAVDYISRHCATAPCVAPWPGPRFPPPAHRRLTGCGDRARGQPVETLLETTRERGPTEPRRPILDTNQPPTHASVSRGRSPLCPRCRGLNEVGVATRMRSPGDLGAVVENLVPGPLAEHRPIRRLDSWWLE